MYLKCRSGNLYVYHSIRYGDRVVSQYQMPYRKWLKLGYKPLDVNVYRLPKPCLRALMSLEREFGYVE